MTQNKRSTPARSTPQAGNRSGTASKSSPAPSKYSYERTDKPPKKSSPLLPILGLIFFILFAVGGWLASKEILSLVARAIPGIRVSDIPEMTGRIVATVAVVIIGMIVFGLLAALLTPKDAQSASEKDLAKEKEIMKERARAERAQKRSRGR